LSTPRQGQSKKGKGVRRGENENGLLKNSNTGSIAFKATGTEIGQEKCEIEESKSSVTLFHAIFAHKKATLQTQQGGDRTQENFQRKKQSPTGPVLRVKPSILKLHNSHCEKPTGDQQLARSPLGAITRRNADQKSPKKVRMNTKKFKTKSIYPKKAQKPAVAA